jgi:SnoaL-like domain
VDGEETDQSARLRAMADRDEIRQLIYRYCRGIDRRRYDLVRACYHPDATDDHGEYRGGIDGFIDYVARTMTIWESTNHFVGNILIDLDGDRARVESYAIAFHHMAPRNDKPVRELIARIRYVDDFERREGVWRIAARLSLVDATRRDELTDWVLGPEYTRGSIGADDPVFWPSVAVPSETGLSG